jgi:hypothetical protein
MKQLDIALDNIAETLSSARQVAFVLAGFSIAAIYIVLVSGSHLEKTSTALETERHQLESLLKSTHDKLAELRAFYERPADDNHDGLEARKRAIETAVLQLNSIRRSDKIFSPKDRNSLASITEELQRELEILLMRTAAAARWRNDRIAFEQLSVLDLGDLLAISRIDVRPFVEKVAILIRITELAKTRGGTSGIDIGKHFQRFPKLVPSPAFTDPRSGGANLFSDLMSSGYRTLQEVKARITAIDAALAENRKQQNETLKLPFIDQPIGASTLAWAIPITATLGFLFCVFYVSRGRALIGFSAALDPEATRTKMMYPWIYVWQPEQDYLSRCVATCLRIAIIGAPLAASGLLLWRAHRVSEWPMLSLIIASNIALIACVAAFVYELVRLHGVLNTLGTKVGTGPVQLQAA